MAKWKKFEVITNPDNQNTNVKHIDIEKITHVWAGPADSGWLVVSIGNLDLQIVGNVDALMQKLEIEAPIP